jgi:hypothetical protein
MNALLLETWVGVSTSASTLWAAITATARQDSLYQRMREHAMVGKQIEKLLYAKMIHHLSDHKHHSVHI